jgi:meso-butanediol dehydrogenase/(S,S)-butanediol dehydrogenase/diacetyl reductase
MSDPSTTRPVAVVTGGARGIGLAIARWFLARNHGVALIDIDAQTLGRTEGELDDPARVLCVHADVSQPDQVARAVAAVDARFGRIDALVNNAGVAIFKPILQTSHEEFRHVLATNLDGAFLCTQAVAPVMLRGIAQGLQAGGAVVNIASISGLRASTLRVAYGTSKGALIHLTKRDPAQPLRHGRRDRQRGRIPLQHRGGLRQRPGAGGRRRLRRQRGGAADPAAQRVKARSPRSGYNAAPAASAAL